jgi:hypothetical protein
MSRLIKIFLTALIALNIASCATAKVEKDNLDKQNIVKQKVLNLLEKEYSQKFKILSFDYKQENYSNPANDCVFLYCKSTKIGIYNFKIQSIKNPIIVMDFKISNQGKESTKELISSFKKSQLKEAYCVGLGMYYKKKLKDKTEVKQPNTEDANKYCESIGQPMKDTFFVRNYNNRHQAN